MCKQLLPQHSDRPPKLRIDFLIHVHISLKTKWLGNKDSLINGWLYHPKSTRGDYQMAIMTGHVGRWFGGSRIQMTLDCHTKHLIAPRAYKLSTLSSKICSAKKRIMWKAYDIPSYKGLVGAFSKQIVRIIFGFEIGRPNCVKNDEQRSTSETFDFRVNRRWFSPRAYA